MKNLHQTCLDEVLVGLLLNLDEVWHFERFIDLLEAHTDISAKLSGFDHRHNHSILNSCSAAGFCMIFTNQISRKRNRMYK